MYSKETASIIQKKLEEQLSPTQIQVIDESHLHAGHGAPGKGGNYRVFVVSEKFSGLNSLKRHRMIFKILEHEKSSGAIHALQMKTLTPEELT